jgi:uncharacterized protein YeaO (DUF488 family)
VGGQVIRVKRAYEPHDERDGHRVLVERLWPRGLRKEDAHFDEWLKDVAPSGDLRKWFHHDVALWGEFQERYRHELTAKTAVAGIEHLLKSARAGTVTLVYAAHDEEHNSAIVLKSVLEHRLKRSR